MRQTWLRRSVLAALVGIIAGALPPVAARQDDRLVAIADIHGAIGPFTTILRRVGLINASDQWSGGKTTFVQTGDYTDRGAGVRAVLNLLMSLEEQARRAGGRAIVLLGNHEVMNLIGDFRDVGPDAYATFADAESEKRRASAYESYQNLAASRAAPDREVAEVYRQTREAWMAAHPSGWLEYRAAMAPNGVYGAWLRRKPIFAKVSGTLFMHAGLNPVGTPAPRAEDADQQVRSEIQRLDRFRQRLVDAKLALPFFTFNEILEVAAAEIRAVNAVVEAAKTANRQPDLSGFNVDLVREAAEVLRIGDWAMLAEQGPMWYRGYAVAPDAAIEAPLAATLARNNVRRIVVGHTPQRDGRIVARFGGRVLLLDTGMLVQVYKGRPAALELRGTQATALYVEETQTLPSPVQPQAP